MNIIQTADGGQVRVQGVPNGAVVITVDSDDDVTYVALTQEQIQELVTYLKGCGK